MANDSAADGDIFDRWADSYDQQVRSSSTLFACYDDVLAEVARLARPGPGRHVLDLGAGTGNLAELLRAGGAAVTCMDSSAGMLERAVEKLGHDPDVHFLGCDDAFSRIPFCGACFDAVVSTFAFHHVPRAHHGHAVREMLRALCPGGAWVIGDLAFADEVAERKALTRHGWLEPEEFARLD
ncbi:MAG TPA: class I SAM-dependent methyltransferase, partial [Armatimonadota bacterium]|nr:class I SAM-dependent methyltransferase [Armatimonadota bacterium]